MLSAKVTYTGMNPILSTMYLVMATVLSTGPIFAAHIPIMNDLFLEQNEIVEPSYSKFDNRVRQETNVIEDEGNIQEHVRVELKTPHVTRTIAGGRVELVCEANGSPPPQIKWYKGGELVQESGFDEQNDLSLSVLASVRSRLTIDCASSYHQGHYTCEAVAGSQTKKTREATIHVEGGDNKTCHAIKGVPRSPRIVTWSPVTIATMEGDISLPCFATGHPAPQIYWVNQDGVMVENNSRIKVLDSGELFISKLRWSDMGEYTCLAVSPMGKSKESTFLYPLSEEEMQQKTKRNSVRREV